MGASYNETGDFCCQLESYPALSQIGKHVTFPRNPMLISNRDEETGIDDQNVLANASPNGNPDGQNLPRRFVTEEYRQVCSNVRDRCSSHLRQEDVKT